MKRIAYILLTLISVECSSDSNAKGNTCLPKHEAHQLNSDMISINHKWKSFIDSLTSDVGKKDLSSSSEMIDNINSHLQQIKDTSSRIPCGSDDQSDTLDRASETINTIQSNFDILMHPTDAEQYSADTGSYKYQGGAASIYGQSTKHTAAVETAYPNYGYNQGYYGYNGYGGSNGYDSPEYYPSYEYPQNPPYGEYSGNGQPNRNLQPQSQPQPQQQPPYYAQPQPQPQPAQPAQSGNAAPALNDKNGDFILKFSEKVVETVLYQLEVIGGVFHSQKNSKSLSLVSELETSVKHFSSKYA